MALPADLFLQAWRPSAYVISGSVNWLCMFLVGMLFSYIVVRKLLCIISYWKYAITMISLYSYMILAFSSKSLLLCASLQKGLGQFCFLIFVADTILSAAFVICFVPETKGKTIAEITEDFNTLNYKNRAADIHRADAVVLATHSF